MPIYEYRCSSCAFQKEYLQKLSDPISPSARSAASRRSQDAERGGFQLKASGWYATEFQEQAPPRSRMPRARPPLRRQDKGDVKPTRSPDAKSDKKSDTKPESKSDTKAESQSPSRNRSRRAGKRSHVAWNAAEERAAPDEKYLITGLLILAGFALLAAAPLVPSRTLLLKLPPSLHVALAVWFGRPWRGVRSR